MKGNIYLIVAVLLLWSCQATDENQEEIRRIDRPESSILKGVFIPKGKDVFYTSGLVSEVRNPDAVAGDMSKYGNTYQQSISTLKRIEETLIAEGFSMEDVFFLRVYLAPTENGEIDWNAWFKAYGEYFNNEKNPNKVARSTLGVYKLAAPELLVEIEAVAAK